MDGIKKTIEHMCNVANNIPVTLSGNVSKKKEYAKKDLQHIIALAEILIKEIDQVE